MEQMQDGQVQDGHKVLSARKRLGMVGVLAVVAGTAVFFNAEEQAAEAKIWDSEMAGKLFRVSSFKPQRSAIVLVVVAFH